MITSCKKNTNVAATGVLLFLFSELIPIEQLVSFRAEAGELACIDYDESENTISINCNASFLSLVQAINNPDILEQESIGVAGIANGQYILNANLEIADGVTFAMTSAGDGLQYLKLAGENGIIVYGMILIDGVRITSWDIEEEDVIQQDVNGTIRRGFVQFAASEGAQILNSEFGYLGDIEPGRRGFDLFGEGPSHDMLINNSIFHNMWMAFYSNGAYNVTVDRSEYYDNIQYSLDPHTTTHDMNITNNWIHDNPIGPICSDRCWDILIEGNLIENTETSAIFFSRNMTDSIARNNHVINARTGVQVSESPNNQIYNNTIEGATREGIGLFNPELPDDGLTEGNLVYDNVISDSDIGIRATRSHNNIVQNTIFSDIESSEYRLLSDSSLTISGQQFNDDVLITEGDSQTSGSTIEIVNSGVIQVRDGGDEDDEEEGDSYNTDIEPFRRTLSDGDEITVNSP
ncbi:MAG: right-handed parallel beta-helix repeat-containing protein [Thermoproteota archaeon]|nr:right-handed parallel beta-helix repeat-containing protein [Thermoproteota archaeon]